MLYGVGRRLDDAPELLFTLRGVDHLALIDQAVTSLPESAKAPPTATLSGDLLLMAKKSPVACPLGRGERGLDYFAPCQKTESPGLVVLSRAKVLGTGITHLRCQWQSDGGSASLAGCR